MSAPTVRVVSINDTDKAITVLIGSVRYEYFFLGDFNLVAFTIKNLLAKSRHGAALEMLKRLSIRTNKL